MPHHLLAASGYLTIFLPFGLLIAGQVLDLPYLAAAVIFGLGPLSRPLLGNVSDKLPEWDERTSSMLDRLPVLYAAAFPFLLGWFLTDLSRNAPGSMAAWVGLGLSVWTCLFFAVVVAHELAHQSGVRRRLGRLLGGAAGYPWLGFEHHAHHSTSGNVDLAEWPRRDESLWVFVLRRTARVFRSAAEYDRVEAARLHRIRSTGSLMESMAATGFSAACFAVAAGTAGALLYLCAAAGVHFGVQAITYLQHWGLGVDSVEDANERRLGWEDRCRFQVWLMLHLALHHAHHHNSAIPYYRLAPHPASPRLPAGYVLLLVASFIPPLWRWLMVPALEAWTRDPLAKIEPVRWRLVCLPGHYREPASS